MNYTDRFESATVVNGWSGLFDLALGAAGLPLTYGTYTWGLDAFRNVTTYEFFRPRMEGDIGKDFAL
ncbi:MAG: hypothetical protein AAFX99_12425, partial [Myxococcota bacterium]